MILHIIAALMWHLACGQVVDALKPSNGTSYGNWFNTSHPANPTTEGILLPAYHRNVSAGAAWVMPASPLDLGARAMTCECFNPDREFFHRLQTAILLLCLDTGRL